MAQLSLFDAPNRMLASVSPQRAWLRRYGWKRPTIANFDPPTDRPKLPLESRSGRYLYLLDAAIPLVPSVLPYIPWLRRYNRMRDLSWPLFQPVKEAFQLQLEPHFRLFPDLFDALNPVIVSISR